jgi:hypothetical protein
MFRSSSSNINSNSNINMNSNKQPTTNNQQTTNNKQQTTNNKQQTTNNKQQTTNNQQQKIKPPPIASTHYIAANRSSESPLTRALWRHAGYHAFAKAIAETQI